MFIGSTHNHTLAYSKRKDDPPKIENENITKNCVIENKNELKK